MTECRDPRPDLENPGQIDVRKADTNLFAHVEEDFAPRIDDQRMAEGLSPVLVAAGLGSCDDEQAGFDCPGAEEHMPMGLARGYRKGGWDGDDVRIRLGEACKQCRETQVVADRQPELAHRSSVDQNRPLAALVHGGLSPTLAGRQVDIEQMDLVVRART